jgi:hypothetical protein
MVHERHVESEMTRGRRICIQVQSIAGQGIQLLLSKKNAGAAVIRRANLSTRSVQPAKPRESLQE